MNFCRIRKNSNVYLRYLRKPFVLWDNNLQTGESKKVLLSNLEKIDENTMDSLTCFKIKNKRLNRSF